MTSWAEVLGYIEPMLLLDSDAMSMACGLELRVSFMDHQLVEIALRMPQHFQRPGKALLSQACTVLFPSGNLNRPRQCFALPMAAWMPGRLRPLCLQQLEFLSATGCLDPAWYRNQWKVFESDPLHWSLGWNLLLHEEFDPCKSYDEFRRNAHGNFYCSSF